MMKILSLQGLQPDKETQALAGNSVQSIVCGSSISIACA
jgi:hypothetical protein